VGEALRGWPGAAQKIGNKGDASEWNDYKLNNEDLLPDIFKVGFKSL